MSHQIGGIDVKFRPLNPDFHNWWIDFEPSTRVLPKGWKREECRRPLPEEIVWKKDVAIPLRDGVKLRADIFLPSKTGGKPLPALLPWSPYGKTGSGMLPPICRNSVEKEANTMLTAGSSGLLSTPDFGVGINKDALSGLEKFEAPDPAEWCPRGYILVQPDARGTYESEGDMFFLGTQAC